MYVHNLPNLMPRENTPRAKYILSTDKLHHLAALIVLISWCAGELAGVPEGMVLDKKPRIQTVAQIRIFQKLRSDKNPRSQRNM